MFLFEELCTFLFIGVLISDKYVITAAHCQPGFLASLVAVFGEYDISGDLETRKPVSRNVKRVIVHRKYDAATFENDLALLELESPVKFDAHISKFWFNLFFNIVYELKSISLSAFPVYLCSQSTVLIWYFYVCVFIVFS